MHSVSVLLTLSLIELGSSRLINQDYPVVLEYPRFPTLGRYELSELTVHINDAAVLWYDLYSKIEKCINYCYFEESIKCSFKKLSFKEFLDYIRNSDGWKPAESPEDAVRYAPRSEYGLLCRSSCKCDSSPEHSCSMYGMDFSSTRRT